MVNRRTIKRRENVINAIKTVQFHAVESYIRQCRREQFNVQDEEGDTLLHKAAQTLMIHENNPGIIADCVRIVKLLARYVDGRIRNRDRTLAVYVVFQLTNKKIKPALDALLAEDGVRELCCKTDSMLTCAVRWSKWDIVQKVIKRETNSTRQCVLKQVALNTICRENVVSPDGIMRLLRDVINVRDIFVYTPLMTAAQNGNSQCVMSLVEHGADVNS